LHPGTEKIVQNIKRVREEVTLRKPFRPLTRVSQYLTWAFPVTMR
jgi:hypothetical protein